MSLRRERRRRRASITSLIDVIFLLLLFFMLSSTFSRFSELNVASVADQQGLSQTAQSDWLRLKILPDTFVLNGARIQESDLHAALSASLTTHSSISVEIADQVTTERMIETLVQLHAIDGVTIQLVEPT